MAAILHLGNLKFVENNLGNSVISNPEILKAAAKLFQVTSEELSTALCTQVVAARGDIVIKKHDAE